MTTGSRREARERALEILYEGYAKDATADETLAGLMIAPDPFAEELVRGVQDRGTEIDELISHYAKGWTLDRMPVLDRTLLRMAVYELLSDAQLPVGVVISEAVELAKRYSTDDSGRFVNGVLASVAAAVRTPSPEQ
jgi:N utilization substance protein B